MQELHKRGTALRDGRRNTQQLFVVFGRLIIQWNTVCIDKGSKGPCAKIKS